jgi:hypothetical protein
MDPDRNTVPSSSACRVGFWCAALLSLTGVVYIAVVGGFIALHGLVLPATGPVQLFGGTITLLDAQLLLTLMAALHETAPMQLWIWRTLALIFTALFDAMVSINRFVQLSVVQQRLSAGETEGIGWFLAYGTHSAMLALEILGWGFFLGIACLCAAPLFSAGKIELSIRPLFVLYGVLGLITALGFVLASPIAAVGVFAWGIVLPATTTLLALYFRGAPATASSH